MVERAERKWLWGFALFVVALTALPYLLGYFTQGSDWRYTGLLIGIEDGNSYIAKMLRGANGEWLFRTPYSPYPQRGAIVLFAYILLGKLTAPPGQHEQLVAVFHLFRSVGAILYVFATYDFAALFLQAARWRRLATALVTFGEGLGWLSLVGLRSLWGRELPLDFYSPETFGFMMVYALPHLACARAFLLWALREYLLSTRQPRLLPGWKSSLRMFLLWFGVWIMQPLTVVVGWAVIAAHIAVTGLWHAWQARFRQSTDGSSTNGKSEDWQEWKAYVWRAVWAGILSVPLVLYTFLSFKFDPYLSVWETRNTILSPPFSHYLLAYGMILPLSLLGIRPLLREAKWIGWLVVGWVAVFPLLAYAPYTLQRRLPEGVWAAVIILFVKWVECSGPVVRRWAPRWSALTLISTIVFLTGGMMSTASPRPPIFLPTGEVKAFEFLAGKTGPQDLVLAANSTANPLPAWAGVRTVLGHGPESIHKDELLDQVTCFYSTCSDTDRINILRQWGIRYIIWGPDERTLGNWNPQSAKFLKPLYQEGNYLILEYGGSS